MTPDPSTPIEAVLFDFDDTLFDHRGAVAGAIRSGRDARGGDVDDDVDVRRWHELEEHHYHRYLAGELDIPGQRRARARDFAADVGIELDDAGATAWWDEYHARYRSGWRLHEDAEHCLDALSGVRLGIITNGDLAIQTGKVRAVGVERRFDVIVTSGELGIAKPDPRIFREACSRLGVAPSRAAYVGDRLETDALGAAAADLLGIWLDRAGAATSDDLRRAAAAHVPVIRTLDALPPLLGPLG